MTSMKQLKKIYSGRPEYLNMLKLIEYMKKDKEQALLVNFNVQGHFYRIEVVRRY